MASKPTQPKKTSSMKRSPQGPYALRGNPSSYSTMGQYQADVRLLDLRKEGRRGRIGAAGNVEAKVDALSDQLEKLRRDWKSDQFAEQVAQRVAGALTERFVRELRAVEANLLSEIAKLQPLPLPPDHFSAPKTDQQRDQNALAQKEFLEASGGLLTSAEVADLLGSKAKNRYAPAHQLRENGRLFHVRWKQHEMYPKFQFDLVTGSIYPEVPQLIRALENDYEQGWQMALWFVTINDWLEGKRPLDVWRSDRRRVVNAAEQEKMMFNE